MTAYVDDLGGYAGRHRYAVTQHRSKRLRDITTVQWMKWSVIGAFAGIGGQLTIDTISHMFF